jgi:chromosome segregation ATPase
MPVNEQKKDWKEQTLTIPVGALLLAGGMMFGGGAGSYLGDDHEKELAEIRLQLHDVQKELHDTNQRLQELSDLIDRAYPRSLPPPR